jgi:hypothetical protein
MATAVGTYCRDVGIWNVASKNRTRERVYLMSLSRSTASLGEWT